MRLICPNCGAQYEVDESVIPDNGRDVQCSNCGHTWYQRSAKSGPDPDVGASDEIELPADDGSDAVADDIPAHPADPEPKPEPEPAEPEAAAETPPTPDHPDEPAEDKPAPSDDEPEEPGPQPELSPRGLDKDVASILRSEADRETAERSAENAGLQDLPDLGLSDTPEDTDAGVKRRMDRLRGLDDDHGAAAAAAAVGAAPRKDLLPDIEELNSTLTASADEAGEEPEEIAEDQQRRSGFRRGFAISILVFSFLVLIYIFAARIAESVPALKPALTSYVDWVNALRVTVDGMMQKAVDKLTVLVSQIGGEGDG